MMNWTRQIVENLEDQARVDLEALNREMEPISLEGLGEMNVFQAGPKDGPAMIFLPMVSEQNFVYAPQVAEFSDRYRTIVFQPLLRRDSRYSVEDRALEVLKLADALEIPAVNLVAWSDTGSPAYYFARHWPDRCQSAVFLNLSDRYRFPFFTQMLVNFAERLPVERILPDWMLAKLLSKYLGGERISKSFVATNAAKIDRLAYLFKFSILPNLTEHLPLASDNVRVPSVVIVGDNGALVSVEEAQRMADILNCECKIVRGGEHFLPYANADEVNREIETFYSTQSL